jgi:hypothetical protein
MSEETVSVVSEPSQEVKPTRSANQMGHRALRERIAQLEGEFAAYKAGEAERQRLAVAMFAKRCMAARSRFFDFDEVLALAASRAVPHRAEGAVNGRA